MGLISLRTLTNKLDTIFDANLTTWLFAEDWNSVKECLQNGNAGINPEFVKSKYHVFVPQPVTIASTGDVNPASLTLVVTSSDVRITNNDPDGANVTISQSGLVDGQVMEIMNVGTNPITILHISGQVEIPEQQNRVLHQWEIVRGKYVVDRLVVTNPPGGAV